MKQPNIFIKSLTVFSFTIIMLGFVILKSGCRYDRYVKRSAKALLEKENEYDFEELNANGELDTVRYWDTDTFVVIKEYIPSPKSAGIFTPEIIFEILDEDELPEDFQETFYEDISGASVRAWIKAQELKQKRKYKKKQEKRILRKEVDKNQTNGKSKSIH